jgi:hypothetical protein
LDVDKTHKWMTLFFEVAKSYHRKRRVTRSAGQVLARQR